MPTQNTYLTKYYGDIGIVKSSNQSYQWVRGGVREFESHQGNFFFLKKKKKKEEETYFLTSNHTIIALSMGIKTFKT